MSHAEQVDPGSILVHLKYFFSPLGIIMSWRETANLKLFGVSALRKRNGGKITLVGLPRIIIG